MTKNQVGFEIPFQYAVSIAKVEDTFELRFAIWTQALDDSIYVEPIMKLRRAVMHTDRRIVGVARFMDRVDDPSLWMLKSAAAISSDETSSFYCDAEVVRDNNVQCDINELIQNHAAGNDVVQPLPVLCTEDDKENCCQRLYNMLVNSLVDISSCEIVTESRECKVFAIPIDSCATMFIVTRVVSENTTRPYLELRYRYVTFARVVQSIVQSDGLEKKRRSTVRKLRSISFSEKSSTQIKIRRQVESELRETVLETYYQHLICVLYYSVRYLPPKQYVVFEREAREF